MILDGGVGIDKQQAAGVKKSPLFNLAEVQHTM